MSLPSCCRVQKPNLAFSSSISVYNFLVAITATPTVQAPPIVVNVLIMLSAALLCCSMPRFIINVRELYDRDLRGRWQGIDTGFGGASRGIPGTSTIAFADAGQKESLTLCDDGGTPGGIQLKPVGEGSHQV